MTFLYGPDSKVVRIEECPQTVPIGRYCSDRGAGGTHSKRDTVGFHSHFKLYMIYLTMPT